MNEVHNNPTEMGKISFLTQVRFFRISNVRQCQNIIGNLIIQGIKHCFLLFYEELRNVYNDNNRKIYELRLYRLRIGLCALTQTTQISFPLFYELFFV